jgi:hypothetical protein
MRGSNRRLYTRTLPFGGTWSPWTDLGGGLASGPAAVSFGSGALDVFVTGLDHVVRHRSRSAARWSAWRSLGGRTYTAPAATWVAQTGTTWVFVRGTDNMLYLRQGRASTRTGWQGLGGKLIDAPAAVAASGGIDVVVRGTDNALWSRRQRDGAWSGWSRAWVPAAPTPPPSPLLGVDWTRIPTSPRVVALTFDAGANADAIPSILTTLRTKNVPATFFLTGQWVRASPPRPTTWRWVGSSSATTPIPTPSSRRCRMLRSGRRC